MESKDTIILACDTNHIHRAELIRQVTHATIIDKVQLQDILENNYIILVWNNGVAHELVKVLERNPKLIDNLIKFFPLSCLIDRPNPVQSLFGRYHNSKWYELLIDNNKIGLWISDDSYENDIAKATSFLNLIKETFTKHKEFIRLFINIEENNNNLK